jgi:hypothetical protein
MKVGDLVCADTDYKWYKITFGTKKLFVIATNEIPSQGVSTIRLFGYPGTYRTKRFKLLSEA